MKTILMLFDGTPINFLRKNPVGYNDIYEYFSKNDVTLCRAPISYYDVQNNTFKKAQFFINNKWIWKDNITPDVVYDKSKYHVTDVKKRIRRSIEKNYTFYNNLKISKLMSDKSLTFNFFKKFSANTVIINDASDLERTNQLMTSRIIVKPLTQSGGRGIFITNKKSLNNDILSNNFFPVMAQEFIDSKKAHNTFVNGYNDVRVIIRNTTPFYAFVRIPQENKLIANVSQGASLRVIPINDLLSNPNVRQFIEDIICEVNKIDNSKKIYAIDFMFDNDNKIWLIEMNSRPGLLLEESELPYQNKFYDNLLTFFK